MYYYYYYWRENKTVGQSVVGGPIVPTKLCPLCRKTRNAERKKKAHAKERTIGGERIIKYQSHTGGGSGDNNRKSQ